MIDESDSQTTDKLYQAVLPVHANSDLYLHPYGDVILDTVNSDLEADLNNAPVDCPRLERLDHLELCSSFAKFEFLGWSAQQELEAEDDGFLSDLEPSLPIDDKEINYFDVENDDDQTTTELVSFVPASIIFQKSLK